MKRMNWVIGSMLALLLVGGLAIDVSAQQQPSGQVQTPQVPSSNVQIESRTERTERVVEQPARFLGMDPTIVMVIGAVLFIVIVVGLVAMSRRTEEVHHTHRV